MNRVGVKMSIVCLKSATKAINQESTNPETRNKTLKDTNLQARDKTSSVITLFQTLLEILYSTLTLFRYLCMIEYQMQPIKEMMIILHSDLPLITMIYIQSRERIQISSRRDLNSMIEDRSLQMSLIMEDLREIKEIREILKDLWRKRALDLVQHSNKDLILKIMDSNLHKVSLSIIRRLLTIKYTQKNHNMQSLHAFQIPLLSILISLVISLSRTPLEITTIHRILLLLGQIV